MTETEEQHLRALGDTLARASVETTEPRRIVHAFAARPKHRLALTMQNWIDLESIHSPLLRLQFPESLADLERAANIFCLSVHTLTMEATALVARALRRAVAEAFALALPMRRPGGPAGLGSSAADGFGSWLPLLAFLVVECGLDPASARELRVDQAFALLAACRRNQGWESSGLSYAQRDAIHEKEEA